MKDFAPYEQALALKELGFDEPCLGNYFHTKELKIYGGDILRIKNSDMGTVTAPTFSQAFRWFREKYDLGHMINGIGHESFIMNIAGVLHIFNAFEFNTYEEAELACLEKLLEIVESKKE